MKILNKLKKLSLSIILLSLVFFYSCNKEGLSAEDETQFTDLTEFVNVNLSNNNLKARVNSVNQFKLEDYSKYTDKVESFSRNNDDLEPYSVEMNLEGRVFNVHTIPTSETNASLFIESEDGEFEKIVELNIGTYNELTDENEIFWIDNSENYSRSDCTEGASVVMAVGTVVSFGRYIGCVPCAFIGGAVATVGAIGVIICQSIEDDEE